MNFSGNLVMRDALPDGVGAAGTAGQPEQLQWGGGGLYDRKGSGLGTESTSCVSSRTATGLGPAQALACIPIVRLMAESHTPPRTCY